MAEQTQVLGWQTKAGMLLVLFLAQAMLWLNPGYFSHDELQWAARAEVPDWRQLPFLSFSDGAPFQFRPLTFNLWLLLSHALFDTPQGFHAVFVLLGSGIAVVLAAVLRRAGTGPQVACVAAAVFALGPYAVWVQGWVGCLADLIWVGLGLGLVWMLQVLDHSRKAALTALVLAVIGTLLALYAKEAALSIPALLGLGACLLRWPRNWLLASIGSAAVALLYLALRWPVLMQADPASSYAVQWLAPPQRWFEYQAFTWALGRDEVHLLLRASGLSLGVLALVLVGLLWVLGRAAVRVLVLWLLGGIFALGPVLVLPQAHNQYAYGFAALSCAAVALAWVRLGRAGRGFLLLLAAFSVLHGFQIQRTLLQTGQLQAVFSPSLIQAAQARPQGDILLWPEDEKNLHVYARLSQNVPSYRGVPLGERVRMAADVGHATHGISREGRVYPREWRSP